MMRYLVFIISILLMAACNSRVEKPEEPIDYAALRLDSLNKVKTARFADARISAADLIREVIENRQPGDRFRALDVDLYSSVLLPGHYIDRSFMPMWISHPDSLGKVQQMLRFIEGAEFHGLIPGQYHLAKISGLYDEIRKDSSLIFNRNYLANIDLLLSDAYFILASHLYHGKIDPESLEALWGIRRNKAVLPFEVHLKEILSSGSIENGFRNFYPPHPGYEAMVKEARKLHQMQEGDFSVKINPKMLSVKPGDSADYIADIKKKLEFLGLYQTDTLDNIYKYDEKAVDGIKKLQELFGYNTDGAIGKNTLKALNMPVKERISQLYVNMERMRWMPDSLEPLYVMVNIADFTLGAFRGSDTLITMRTIVGKNYRETPVFNSKITYLVMSPSWTVPPTIQRKDIIPEVSKSVGYLAGKNMKVFDSKGKSIDPSTVNWRRDGMRYTIRQAPGASNALGKVKFMFPNKHNVYLHDTPTRELFKRDERTFSSGCIRIEKPFELAQLLMADMPDWTPERIRQSMNSGSERTVVLKSPVGVYIYYLTAWGGSDGKIHYRSDIYERDKEMLKVLKDKPAK
ncbi:MAG: murein L,D-transpeptidase [Bacteroidetes bacterium HGW-Bacteroidetes-11]|nr:MAG: murein L,D-transpeptidase [Bacteroidetes bacterium HGW-Bacteroidetes-11]